MSDKTAPGGPAPGHVTKAELEQELIDLRASQDSDLVKARQWFAKQVAQDIAWWYARAQNIAEKGTTRTDQVRYQMVKAILDKVLPDKKEITRGAASVVGASVHIDLTGQNGGAPAAVTGEDDGQTLELQ